jgi:hypothetical protein
VRVERARRRVAHRGVARRALAHRRGPRLERRVLARADRAGVDVEPRDDRDQVSIPGVRLLLGGRRVQLIGSGDQELLAAEGGHELRVEALRDLGVREVALLERDGRHYLDEVPDAIGHVGVRVRDHDEALQHAHEERLHRGVLVDDVALDQVPEVAHGVLPGREVRCHDLLLLLPVLRRLVFEDLELLGEPRVPHALAQPREVLLDARAPELAASPEPSQQLLGAGGQRVDERHRRRLQREARRAAEDAQQRGEPGRQCVRELDVVERVDHQVVRQRLKVHALGDST